MLQKAAAVNNMITSFTRADYKSKILQCLSLLSSSPLKPCTPSSFSACSELCPTIRSDIEQTMHVCKLQN